MSCYYLVSVPIQYHFICPRSHSVFVFLFSSHLKLACIDALRTSCRHTTLQCTITDHFAFLYSLVQWIRFDFECMIL